MRSAMRLLGAVTLVVALIAACNSEKSSDRARGQLPAGALTILAKPAYATARWLYYVADRDSGEVLLSQRPDELVLTGSTAKQFTIGTVYDSIGPNTRLTTPVYATAPVDNGVLHGDVILVASGDLTLGGRGAMHGRVDDAFDATSIDHVYGDIAPNARKVNDDPLAGLNDLAHQVAAKGVKTIDGDVLVDTRIWQSSPGRKGAVPPIFVNDNLLDIEVTPGAVGQPATVRTTPGTTAFTVQSKVSTVKSNNPSSLEVSADPTNPRNIVVNGLIPQGKPQLTIYRVPDADTWARTLFIEALGRAGITVCTPALGPNDQSRLPAPNSYSPRRRLASLQSPPLQAFGSMTLRTSYNAGANAMLCLLATKSGSTDCTDGLRAIRAAVEKAGLRSDSVVLTDGEGAYPASSTPKQMAAWNRWAARQRWGSAFVSGQPVLAATGTLAPVGRNSPAKGKVQAKTGTVAVTDPATGRALVNVQSLAGYMTTDKGRHLVFDLSMSGATYPDVLTGLQQANDDVGMVAAQIQQSLSK
ncbi:D-alanyl-D-alanine carboxypeptidase/D-alanyl-D-alanine endopeptidase [Mycobacterium noviomagense]|uniref:D-alanyl-D-alanine carboxypeptidase/D-alanyl-D-alanine-endopeptidase n=1 Tax=Mycobacterium noviomagense TaxID=459858 RepID=A0A7I7PBP2_9MYCO|nr:D-alanyl-D-alanine carboxypeptidase/D-alanyl-D-alanine-endopeptidase [Mycobacterium noviomagense]ORB12889.1 D-alanyl-D-alanine carboxypeptidase/D-alanyl-D-alanine-endopeptidase [Mycobacterium noviomagense]BBY05982.1 D-alanyl-D-alanine carboxypeptidase/D-alanyl-D-alanine-endopeptidase [Mycobacterium noviomagense]